MAEKLYVTLPAMVDSAFALSRCDGRLWERTVAFYREVRNPVMHGSEVKSESVDGVAACFEHMALLHKWIDGWRDPRALSPPVAPRASASPSRGEDG
jgi:hypothetical protein